MQIQPDHGYTVGTIEMRNRAICAERARFCHARELDTKRAVLTVASYQWRTYAKLWIAEGKRFTLIREKRI